MDVVVDYKDIHKDTIENGMKSPVDIPYFEGDFWPNVLEECIKEQEQEEEKRRMVVDFLYRYRLNLYYYYYYC